MTFLATVYSHFGAIRYKRACEAAGISATLMPVPRSLSSSCGTCVRCEGDWLSPSQADAEEIEQIVRQLPDGYEVVYRSTEE